MQQVAKRQPRRIIPRTVTGLYARSLHRDHEGEWDFDLAWKPIESWPAYAGWLAAVRPRPADPAPRALRLAVPGAGALERALDGSHRARRGRPLHRHRARRRADPRDGRHCPRPARDLRRHRGRPPRRLPLPRGAPRHRGLRRARPLARRRTSTDATSRRWPVSGAGTTRGRRARRRRSRPEDAVG